MTHESDIALLLEIGPKEYAATLSPERRESFEAGVAQFPAMTDDMARRIAARLWPNG